MTRTRRWWRSVALLVVVIALAGEACGEPTRSPVTTQSASQESGTAVPSAGPFEPLAWPPPGGGAPCDQVQAPDPEHDPYAGLIRRIRAIDASTVEFRLCAPDVAFPTRLAFA